MSGKKENINYIKPNGSWSINPNICKSCGLCILKCPKKVLSFDEENNNYLGTPVVSCNISECILCGTCQNVCPECAILVEKKK